MNHQSGIDLAGNVQFYFERMNNQLLFKILQTVISSSMLMQNKHQRLISVYLFLYLFLFSFFYFFFWVGHSISIPVH